MKRAIIFFESNTTGSGAAFLDEAEALGLQAHLLCANPLLYSDIPDTTRIMRVDTAGDLAAIEAAIRPLSPAGLLTTSTYYLSIAAHLAERLGLPGPNPNAVACCIQKDLQRATLRAGRVCQPRYRACRTIEAAIAAADEVGFPAILKPVQGSGKVGVSLVRNERELRDWAEPLARMRQNERGLPINADFLVEEYFSGREFSIECFNGAPVAICEKQCRPPRFVEESHVTPPINLDPQEREILRRLAADALRVLGLLWGPAHVETRVNAQGKAVIIEVNPRLAGGNIPLLVMQATGIDLIAATIHASIGQQVNLTASRHDAAAVAFIFARDEGRSPVITGLESARHLPGVVFAKAYSRRTDFIRLWGDFRDRVAWVMAAASDPVRSLALATRAAAAIRLEVQQCVSTIQAD